MATNAATEKKPNLFQRLSRIYRETKGEFKRVVWPTREQSTKNTGIVIVFIIIMAIIIGTFDSILSWLIQLFFAA